MSLAHFSFAPSLATRVPRVLAFGELYWQNDLTSQPTLAGSALELVFGLGNLGVNSYLASRVGDDFAGKQALRELGSHGIDVRLIQRDPLRKTGCARVSRGPGDEVRHNFERDVAFDHISLSTDLLSEAKNATAIYFGTMIQRGERSRITLHDLIAANPDSVKFCDLNLFVLPADAIAERNIIESIRRCTILKLNEAELKDLARILKVSDTSASAVLEKVFQIGNAQICMFTKGAGGAEVITREGERLNHPGYRINRVNPIGAGDSAAAAFLSQYLQGHDLSACLDFANKVGALVAGSSVGSMRSLDQSALRAALSDLRMNQPAIKIHAPPSQVTRYPQP